MMSFAVLISVRRNTAEDKTVLTTSCSVFGTSPVSITRIGSRLCKLDPPKLKYSKIVRDETAMHYRNPVTINKQQQEKRQ